MNIRQLTTSNKTGKVSKKKLELVKNVAYEMKNIDLINPSRHGFDVNPYAFAKKLNTNKNNVYSSIKKLHKANVIIKLRNYFNGENRTIWAINQEEFSLVFPEFYKETSFSVDRKRQKIDKRFSLLIRSGSKDFKYNIEKRDLSVNNFVLSKAFFRIKDGKILSAKGRLYNPLCNTIRDDKYHDEKIKKIKMGRSDFLNKVGLHNYREIYDIKSEIPKVMAMYNFGKFEDKDFYNEVEERTDFEREQIKDFFMYYSFGKGSVNNAYAAVKDKITKLDWLLLCNAFESIVGPRMGTSAFVFSSCVEIEMLVKLRMNGYAVINCYDGFYYDKEIKDMKEYEASAFETVSSLFEQYDATKVIQYYSDCIVDYNL